MRQVLQGSAACLIRGCSSAFGEVIAYRHERSLMIEIVSAALTHEPSHTPLP